jgi:hypothetical protein
MTKYVSKHNRKIRTHIMTTYVSKNIMCLDFTIYVF